MIYADFECLLKKMHSYRNNPEKSYTEKKTDSTKNKLDCYRQKECIEKFCKDLREHE